MDETTLVAEIGSTVANDWLKIHGFSEPPKPGELPLPPPPPPGTGPTTATNIDLAGALADKRPLLSHPDQVRVGRRCTKSAWRRFAARARHRSRSKPISPAT